MAKKKPKKPKVKFYGAKITIYLDRIGYQADYEVDAKIDGERVQDEAMHCRDLSEPKECGQVFAYLLDRFFEEKPWKKKALDK